MYDAIIVGSGQAGNPLASALSKRNLKVALIESGPLGGTCVNTGCTPTKTMIASAQVAHYVRNANRWGVGAGEVSVDLPAILKRKHDVVERSRTGWERSFSHDDNVTLYRGRAAFTPAKQVTVGDDTIEGERIFINTGANTAAPKIEGLGAIDYLTNASLMEVTQVPEHLLILGGGYIGLEFGQMFRRFGSQVTILQSNSRILPQEDSDITDELQRNLTAEGIRILTNTKVTKAEKAGGGVVLTAGGEKIAGTNLLVAAGRVPNTKDLTLDKAGVKTDEKGYVVVNHKLETNVPGIWALGDVNGGPAFTHISYNDYQIVYGNLFEGKDLSTSNRIVPYAVYTDPALGRVGLTEKAARDQGYKVKVGKVEMTHVARAIERAETGGLMKIVVDAETNLVLGAAILSADGDEVVQILSMLMLAGQPYTLLKGAIYIHPTIAEGFFSLMDSVK